MAHRVGRGIALLFHDGSTRRGWVVSSMPRLQFTPRKHPVPIVQQAGWVPGPVWSGVKSRPHQDSIPDRPARKLPYIWQCNIRMLSRSYIFVSVLLIVEVSLFHAKMPVKSHQHGQVSAVCNYIRCLLLLLLFIIVSSLVSQQTQHMILILSLFLFYCLLLKRNEMKFRLWL